MTVIPDVLAPESDTAAPIDDEAAFMARVIRSRLEAVDPIEQARRDLAKGQSVLAIPVVRDEEREKAQRKATIEQWRRDVLSGRVDPWERRK